MRFGSREICDVTFKAATNNQKVGKKTFKAGQPVFVIDTATASTMSQETSVVYARGGKGYNNLIAWEGEKTMSFNVTDALLSPIGLGVLTGAGIVDDENEHFHVTMNVNLDGAGVAQIDAQTIIDELGLDMNTTSVDICGDIPIYASVLDNVGSIVDWLDGVELGRNSANVGAEFLWPAKTDKHVDGKQDVLVNFGAEGANKTVKLDFYVVLAQKTATKIRITPDAFGGNFYVEADTLYRAQTGKDMAATLTFPNVKIQSAFELSMSATGDPSTFDFKMDAMPGYTYFDKTKKTVCDIQIIGTDSVGAEEEEHDMSTVEEHTGKNAFTISGLIFDSSANTVTGTVTANVAGEVNLSVADNLKTLAATQKVTIDGKTAKPFTLAVDDKSSTATKFIVTAKLGKDIVKAEVANA